MRKKIAVTIGDAGGVGPEVAIKALSDRIIRERYTAFLIGSAGVIKDALRMSSISAGIRLIEEPDDCDTSREMINVINVKPAHRFPRCRPSAGAGRAAVEYIKKAVDFALTGKVAAVVTGPLSKESLKMAGYQWRGHTEMLAEMTGTKDFAMMFYNRRLKLVLNTIHIPLQRVSSQTKKGRVLKTIEMASLGLSMLGISDPRIAVSGLNPHAGESGLMGKEEIEEIIPAVSEAKSAGINVMGPIPPDVVFYRAYKGEFDIIVCMYHDQGLIPFKMIAFDAGVNVTVGLPIIRTSPDHGTAFDIAWKDRANPRSMIEAIKLAGRLKMRGNG